MGTIAEKLTYLNDTKTAIKNAIIAKGGTLADADNFRGYADGVTSIPSGGGDIGDGAYFVKIIDYDGTVIKEKRLDTGDTFTMPEAPTHMGLVFDGWSCSQAITDSTITVTDNNVIAGAMYHTASGALELDVTITDVTGSVVTLQNLTGVTRIDWGDGEPETTSAPWTHDYSYMGNGDYTIKVYGVTEIGGYIMSQNGGSTVNYTLTNVRINSVVTSIGTNAFNSCYSLTSVTIPSVVTSIGTNAFNSCYSLTSVTIPNGVTSIGTFVDCRSLTSVTIPNGVTSIVTNTFNNCRSLTSVTIPSGVTSMGTNTFYNCCSIISYDFTGCTTVPTLANTNAFMGINGICKIKVPSALYDTWIVATNWSTYADYIEAV